MKNFEEITYEVKANMPVISLSYQFDNKDRHQLIDSKSVFNELSKIYDPGQMYLREYFYAIFLDRSNSVLGCLCISMGGTAGTVVDIKFIVAAACLSNSTSVIVSHNHPSGQKNFSSADIAVTEKIKAALKLVDVTLLDHVLFLGDNYESMADLGII